MAVKYFLLFLKNLPGEENRQYALKHLQDERGTVAVAAIEALASIGRPEVADACLAVAQARMTASEAAYFDTTRNLLNTAYNLFARRLGRPELPVPRDLEPIEFELARKLPVEVATPLVKKIVYMSAEEGIRLLKERWPLKLRLRQFPTPRLLSRQSLTQQKKRPRKNVRPAIT